LHGIILCCDCLSPTFTAELYLGILAVIIWVVSLTLSFTKGEKPK